MLNFQAPGENLIKVLPEENSLPDKIGYRSFLLILAWNTDGRE